MTHHTAIQGYLRTVQNQAVVQVDLLQDGFVTLSLPAAPCCNFATLSNAIAWLLPYGDRPHGVYGQHLTQQGETLVVWFERADTGFGTRTTFSPVSLPNHRAEIDRWRLERDTSTARLRALLLEHCKNVKGDHDRPTAADKPVATYLVAGVDRLSNQPGVVGQGLITVGALVVRTDGEEFQFVGLPGLGETGLDDTFQHSAARATQHGIGWLDLFSYTVGGGNGYTSDYSVPETIQANSAHRAGYLWLRKHLGDTAQHLEP
jgi:hypothetical protein